MRFLWLPVLFFITACTGVSEVVEPEGAPPLTLKAASFSDLPGWAQDDVSAALPALKLSCARILKSPPEKLFGALPQHSTYGDWLPACRALNSAVDVRSVIERHFEPFEVRSGSEAEGLFTGYYEATLRGSRTRYGPYRYPLYARPDDLVMVQLGDFREDLKGRRIAGRVVGGALRPYEDRTQIVNGDWPHAFEKGGDKVLVWVDDPVDAFFVQIQGSGVVELAEGGVIRVGYAGQNGHPYYAIGRELIKRGALTKENVSLQSIRAWLHDNPAQADEVMNTNKSYVFFTESKKPGAIGGEGLPLTAGRSLAIDRSKIPYGVPIYVDIAPPLIGEERLQRLMVAQDTGGAIRGAVRGDVFWGYGQRAEHLAGHMKSKGRYWVFLPR